MNSKCHHRTQNKLILQFNPAIAHFTGLVKIILYIEVFIIANILITMKMLLGTKICAFYWQKYVKSGCAIAGLHCTILLENEFCFAEFFFSPFPFLFFFFFSALLGLCNHPSIWFSSHFQFISLSSISLVYLMITPSFPCCLPRVINSIHKPFQFLQDSSFPRSVFPLLTLDWMINSILKPFSDHFFFKIAYFLVPLPFWFYQVSPRVMMNGECVYAQVGNCYSVTESPVRACMRTGGRGYV